MKILHTADLHIGQVVYQNYDRSDEHQHFFRQLERWCQEEQPDALLVSGDVFDIQQPSATVKKDFTDFFVRLHRLCPQMHTVITAGNHDSASRIQADRSVWKLANAHLQGIPPAIDSMERDDGWQDQYIVKLDSGYIVTLPYMTGDRHDVIQSILDRVAADNTTNLPVVMMAHQAVTGLDPAGHSFDIGTLRTIDTAAMGSGYDYLALGHIHKPQTLGHPEDCDYKKVACHRAPVVRYSGSALHVSCDEAYPHTVSLVEMDRHQGEVHIRQLRIDELRHFYVLPLDGTSFTTADDALQAMDEFVSKGERGYIRFRFDAHTDLPANFAQMVYDALAPYHDEWRYNPKVLWTGASDDNDAERDTPLFEVPELQQMTDPMDFIMRTKDLYPSLDLDDVRLAFDEVKAELLLMSEERETKKRQKQTPAEE